MTEPNEAMKAMAARIAQSIVLREGNTVLEDTQATLSAVKAEAIVDGGGTCLWIAEKLNQQMIDNRAALSATPAQTTDADMEGVMRSAALTGSRKVYDIAQPVDETERLREALEAISVSGIHRDPKWFGMNAHDIARAALSTDKGEASRG